MFWEAQAQGIVAGANMVLVGGPQALLLKELPEFLEDIQLTGMLMRNVTHWRDAIKQRKK